MSAKETKARTDTIYFLKKDMQDLTIFESKMSFVNIHAALYLVVFFYLYFLTLGGFKKTL